MTNSNTEVSQIGAAEAKKAFLPILDLACKIDPSRSGGFLVVWEISKGCLPGFPMPCGVVLEEKRERYHRNSLEKANRLSSHPGDLFSSDSRDSVKEKFGGAVRVSERLILSFSGFVESMDEAAMLAFACKLGYIPQERIEELARTSKLSPQVGVFLKNISIGLGLK